MSFTVLDIATVIVRLELATSPIHPFQTELLSLGSGVAVTVTTVPLKKIVPDEELPVGVKVTVPLALGDRFLAGGSEGCEIRNAAKGLR